MGPRDVVPGPRSIGVGAIAGLCKQVEHPMPSEIRNVAVIGAGTMGSSND